MPSTSPLAPSRNCTSNVVRSSDTAAAFGSTGAAVNVWLIPVDTLGARGPAVEVIAKVPRASDSAGRTYVLGDANNGQSMFLYRGSYTGFTGDPGAVLAQISADGGATWQTPRTPGGKPDFSGFWSPPRQAKPPPGGGATVFTKQNFAEFKPGGEQQFYKPRNDNPRTTIAEIMRLWPRPLYIQYQ